MSQRQESIDSPTLTLESLRFLAKASLRRKESEAWGDHRLNPESREWIEKRAEKLAAVLIPVVERKDSLQVILTRRSDRLPSHSGQVAFPGGKIEPNDSGPEAAALREAHEEIGLEPRRVEIIARLPDYLTGSGYRIAPSVGLIDPLARLRPDPREVGDLFEVPLWFLMNRSNHRIASREISGARRHYLEIPYGERHIWGVTAGIVAMMRERLSP